MLDTVTSLAKQAGSRLDITDDRVPGEAHEFTCTATLTQVQREAVNEIDCLAPGGRPTCGNALEV
ncbi:MAG: hypothetical protein ACLPKE_26090 [Streptosporangiaceae bacterium]